MLRYFRIGTELRRFSRSRMQRLAIVAACLIPLLYGALYLWAFWNPTGHLDRVPVAIVNEDAGATADGTTVHAGTDLTDQLLDKGTLKWQRTDARTAHEGLVSGQYYATLTIPADFSRAVTTAGTDAPVPAPLQVQYNDANGYTTRTILSTVMNEVRTAASDSIGAQMVDKLLIGTSDIRGGLVTAADGATQLTDGADQAHTGAATLDDGLAQLDTGAGQLVPGADAAASGAHQLATGTGQLADGSSQVAAGANQLSAGADTLATGADAAHQGAQQLATGLDTLTAQTKDLPAATKKLADGSAQVAAGDKQIADTAGLAAGQIATATTDLRAALGTLPADDPQVQKAYAALNRIDAKTATLNTQVQQLSDGAQQVAAGNAQLAASAPALADGIAAADQGAGTLATGTGQVADGARTLSTGATSVAQGAGQVHDGAVQAHDGATTLADGLDTLATGAHSLADGLRSAHHGSTTLASGLADLAGGAHRLGDGLTSAVDQIPSMDHDTQQANADTISAPVSLDSAWVHQAEANGEGFAPYFMGLALYVGVLITWMLLRPISDRSLAAPVPALRVVLASWLPGAVVAVVQVALLLGVLVFALGLRLSHPLAAIGFTLLVGLTFLTLQQTINVLLGPAVGRVVVLVLLMLQLTSAGGTYPALTSPPFFQAIHPWLPMTHVVDGLREAITGDLGLQFHTAVAYLVVVIALSLAASTWSAVRRRVWTVQRLHPEVTI
ncbi:YhgE/Pip domain-containing protein [Raineyella sp. LH-20]|uniref:YhgE/Pip domain-containing protein n=1 Tax=Raineyella sp. LH-20 TaxID=3081204 RepID=UPI002953AC59|nr:YhgE/Pip domain-containing protein [Raineyella sp. LH-20]WOP19372.1 YhgE/Pip domain-containing protein [Raineyella sp. LH-20]